MSPNRVPLKNPQPKIRFQASGDNVSKHRDLMDSPEYQRAIDFGLLQYVAAVSQGITDGNTAMAAGFKILGAVELLSTVRMLSETPMPVVVAPVPNLNHQA